MLESPDGTNLMIYFLVGTRLTINVFALKILRQNRERLIMLVQNTRHLKADL